MPLNSMLYSFSVKDFTVNDIQYSAGFTPVIYREEDGQATTGELHIILVNNFGRSLYFHFGGDPAINIDEQLLKPGVVVELIKIYREFWKGEDHGIRFYKMLSDELYQYLVGGGITHFKVADALDEEDQPINSAIDQFLLEAHIIKEGEVSAELLPVGSDQLLNILQAERTQFYLSISPDTYIDFYEQSEKITVVS